MDDVEHAVKFVGDFCLGEEHMLPPRNERRGMGKLEKSIVGVGVKWFPSLLTTSDNVGS
jgi:hypothetical protein